MIQTVKTKDIIANDTNPRVIKDDKFKKLVQSIKDFPQMLQLRPIVVNDDMVVLGGNMRLRAVQEVGLKEVPIIKASDLTPEQQKEFIIKEKLYELELKLQDRLFARISKSYIISIYQIEKIKPTFNGKLNLILSSREQLEVSRHYIADFRKILGM